MPTTVRINIKGLALCYLDAEAWTVVFVCDAVHPLKIMYPGGRNDELRELGKHMSFSFGNTDFIRYQTSRGEDFARILNMASPQLHGSGNLEIRSSPQVPPNTSFVTLKVPNSRLSGASFSKNPSYAQEVTKRSKARTGRVIPIGRMATVVKLEFGVNRSLNLRIGNFNKQFPVSNAKLLEFVLDNDCGKKCTHNDFADLYHFVKDESQGSERKFLVGKTQTGTKKGPFDLDETTIIGEIKSRDGNCDPVIIDPPPGP